MGKKESLKLDKVRQRGYAGTVEVNSLTHYLLLPKVEDIRMVYNGTFSGLNNSVWVPHFAILTVRSTLWELDRVAYMVYR